MDEQPWKLEIGPIAFDGTILIMCLLTVAIVFGVVFWASRGMKLKPSGKQNVLEYLIDFVSGVIKDNLSPKEVSAFQLFNFVLFGFLLVANNIGLVTKITVGHEVSLWKSPTADPVVTLTLSLIISLFCNYLGAKRFGFKGYLINSFFKPVAFVAPMKIIEEFTNFISLGLRLYGNIFAGEILLGLICQLGMMRVPFTFVIAIPLQIAWIGFSIAISCIQAYIFIILTNVYVGHKILADH